MTDRLEVGRINKPHGLNGEVIVTLTTDQTVARTESGIELWTGDEVLTVIWAKPHQDKFIFSFEGYRSREQADRLRGRTLTAVPLESDDTVFVHDLVGRTVVDQHGVEHGKVVALLANPASDLLELESGSLVPMAFYVSQTDEIITVDVPEGLLGGDI